MVHRISGRRYLVDPDGEIEKVLEALERQPTAEELGVLSGEIALEKGPDAPEDEPPAVMAAPRDEGPVPGPDGLFEEEVHKPDPEPEREGVIRQYERRVPRRLVRWSLQGSQVKGSMFDRLIRIDDRLKTEKRLVDEDIAALNFIRRLAEGQGFDHSEEVTV